MMIVQITDSHVLADGSALAGRFDTRANFDRLIATLRTLSVQPDLILFSGDLGEDATQAEYAHVAKGLRSLGLPVLAVPGNHDLRAPMREELAEMVGTTQSGHLCCCHDTGTGLVVIGLDTVVEGAPHGALCPERLEWLSARLSEQAAQEVLIFMHHPPIQTGLWDMDRMGLLEGQQGFATLIAGHGRVQGILCGHMHRSINGLCGGAPVRVAPSASHQIAFDLRAGEPYRFSTEPAQFAVHIKTADQPLITHLLPISDR